MAYFGDAKECNGLEILSILSIFKFQLSTPVRCPILTSYSASFLRGAFTLAMVARNQSKKCARLEWKSPSMLVIFNDNGFILRNLLLVTKHLDLRHGLIIELIPGTLSGVRTFIHQFCTTMTL